jgi:hypothetical protein
MVSDNVEHANKIIDKTASKKINLQVATVAKDSEMKQSKKKKEPQGNGLPIKNIVPLSQLLSSIPRR